MGHPRISLCWPGSHEGTQRWGSTVLQVRKSCTMLSIYSAAVGPCTTRGALFQVIPPFLHLWGDIHDPGQHTCLSKGKGHTERGCRKAKPHTDAKDLAAKHPHCTQLDWPARDNPRFRSSCPWPSVPSFLQRHLRQDRKKNSPLFITTLALSCSQSSVPSSPGL